MEIRIFNVGHGASALVLGDARPDGYFNIALLDCGSDPGRFQPSQHLVASGFVCVDHLVVSHFDEDHLTDLPNLLALGPRLPILHMLCNNTLMPAQIWQMKQRAGLVEPGVASLIAALEHQPQIDGSVALTARPLLGFQVQVFRNAYLHDFTDPNNLSLVTFLHHPSLSIVFPGDIETAGWRLLLQSPQFRANLARVNVFVTSHHGRSNGYCPEVFEICRPDVFITSDTNREYGTQEQRYDQHTDGILWGGGPQRRKCLTTRQDGHIRICHEPGWKYFVWTGANF